MVFVYRLQCFNYVSSFARAEHGSKLFIDYCDKAKKKKIPVTQPTLILGVDPSFFSRSADPNSFHQYITELNFFVLAF